MDTQSGTCPKPLGAPEIEIGGIRRVSATSTWSDTAWTFDNPSQSAHLSTSRVRWNIELEDGGLLTDDCHRFLLEWLKEMVWGLRYDPGDGKKPLGPATMGSISSGLAKVVPWLVRNAITSPHQLTQDLLDEYLEDLPSILARTQAEGASDIGHNRAVVAINIFYCVWRQRRNFERVDVEPMPRRPWPRLGGAGAVARTVFDKEYGWIEPIPDEVAVPLFNQAFAFVEVCAAEILSLRDLCDESYDMPWRKRVRTPEPSLHIRRKSQRRVVSSFKFSERSGLSDFFEGPAHLPGKRSTSHMLRVKQLLLYLQAACCLVLQGMTGMRVSELCELRSNTTDEILPAGVRKQVSRTGLNEEFILESYLVKNQEHPALVPWLLGSRRIGDSELPIAVRALQVLEQLMHPYQRLLNTDVLLISIRSKIGTPKTSLGVSIITASRISKLYEAFASAWIDWDSLPDQSQYARRPSDLLLWKASCGAVMTTHMLRKSFASYVLSVSPDLLPAVKRQFQHLSMQVTERHYWGSSSPQIEPMQSVTRQATARMLHERLLGRDALGGRMGMVVEREIPAVRSELIGKNDEETWIRINRWLEDIDLNVTHSPHGSCMPINGTRMDCWDRAGLRPVGHTRPNYETRSASVCAGCACFIVHRTNVAYWKRRYIESAVSLVRNDRVTGSTVVMREIERRTKQSRALLANLRVDLAEVDLEVAKLSLEGSEPTDDAS